MLHCGSEKLVDYTAEITQPTISIWQFQFQTKLSRKPRNSPWNIQQLIYCRLIWQRSSFDYTRLISINLHSLPYFQLTLRWKFENSHKVISASTVVDWPRSRFCLKWTSCDESESAEVSRRSFRPNTAVPNSTVRDISRELALLWIWMRTFGKLLQTNDEFRGMKMKMKSLSKRSWFTRSTH